MDSLHMQWRLMHCVRRLKEHASRKLQPFCAAHGITERQLRLLVCLHLEGPMTASSLARLACMAGANNSAVCKQLAQQGLVLRERTAGDERQVIISLSNKGLALMQALEAELTAAAPGCPPEEIERMLYGMEALIAMLEQDKEKAV